ncbi:MAG: PEP-CTERM sorting domain-containing protein [Betaproteobacteria bacterium]
MQTTPRFATAALALAAMICCGPAQAGIFTFAGDTSGAPTFHRAVEDFSSLSSVGVANPYQVTEIAVSVTGSYSFLTTSGGHDAFTFLYSSFNPANATANGIIANDDLLGLTTSGFSASLTAGVSYFFVSTGFAPTDFGSYSTTIGGPGLAAVVPEPATYALMLAGVAGLAAWSRRRRA